MAKENTKTSKRYKFIIYLLVLLSCICGISFITVVKINFRRLFKLDCYGLFPKLFGTNIDATCDWTNSINLFNVADKKLALMYSPFDFTIGGGEKYFFEMLSYILDKDYKVVIVTRKHNRCENLDCILSCADKLNVILDNKLNMLYLRLSTRELEWLHIHDKNKYILNQQFSLYYQMWNEKYPLYPNPSSNIGLYQCQFPYDGYSKPSKFEKERIKYLSTFNNVIVNSNYTANWYQKYLKYQNINIKIPIINVVYPPVNVPHHILTRKSDIIPNEINIIMLGRIFHGRQNKGHFEALKAIQKIKDLPSKGRNYKLNIVGSIVPTFESYAKSLESFVVENDLTDIVQFHFDASWEKLNDLKMNSDILWHLTGIDQDIKSDNNDPASFEHFGISVIECMSTGIYPIVLNEGGVIEAVGKFGKKINNINELIETTRDWEKEIVTKFKLKQIKKWIRRFSVKSFRKSLNLIIDK